MTLSDRSRAARRLAAALEPCIGQVYFAPEAHAAYVELGFAPSPASFGGLAMPDGAAYFTSRGSLMGQVSPTVVAAAFAVFNPAAVVPAVTYGWSLTDADTIRARRRASAVAQLARVLPDVPAGAVSKTADLLDRAVSPLTPEGRPLFSGARDHLDEAGDNRWARLFALGDALREYRGDCHTAAWVSAGVGAPEIGLVSEAYMGLPPRTYSRSRAWSEAEFDAAADRARSRGWLDGDGALTPAGREAREAIEVTTDDQLAPALDALDNGRLDDLVAQLQPWGEAMRAAHGYPGGPADLWPNR